MKAMVKKKKVKCGYCGYRWEPRVSSPISCPRCKRRFDYKAVSEVLKQIDKENGWRLSQILIEDGVN
jgi:DNA-directed RNA polymerase subunit RPC12/RpoP